MRPIILVPLIAILLLVIMSLVYTDLWLTKDVDSSVGVGESSLDYSAMHPVCRDAIIGYSATNPEMVAYMCNMVGDIWVTDLLGERP